MKTPKDKILSITERLGISASVAAKAMQITENTYRKNKSHSNQGHNFTEKNYTNLLGYILDEVKIILKENADDAKPVITLESINIRLDNLFANYENLSKDDDFNLTEEIFKILDDMDDSDVFLNMKTYSNVIERIEKETENLTPPFDVVVYEVHLKRFKRKKHKRWGEYVRYRRQQIIDSIINS